MLCDLIPTGPLTQPNTTESQKESAIASWAIVVLVALCHEPNAGNPQTSSHLLAHSFSADLHAQFKTQFFPKSLLILAMVNCMFCQISHSVFSLPLPLPKDHQQALARNPSKLRRSCSRRTMQLFLPMLW